MGDCGRRHLDFMYLVCEVKSKFSILITSAVNWPCDLRQIIEENIYIPRFPYLKNKRVGLDDL